MTGEIKDQIIAMRAKGVGYRTIASELGITVDKVRYYCKMNGLSGFANNILLFDGKTCPLCGTPIEQPPGKGRKKKFCSDKCRREWWNKHPGAGNKNDSAFYPATCSCCGKDFKAYGNKHRKYCSRDCYIKARFWEK